MLAVDTTSSSVRVLFSCHPWALQRMSSNKSERAVGSKTLRHESEVKILFQTMENGLGHVAIQLLGMPTLEVRV